MTVLPDISCALSLDAVLKLKFPLVNVRQVFDGRIVFCDIVYFVLGDPLSSIIHPDISTVEALVL